MSGNFKAVLLGTAASLLVANGAAQAQQDTQNLSEEEVRSFFDTMQQDTMEAIQAGNFQRLMEWTQNNIAEEANFTVSNEVYRGDERKSFAVVSLNKEDMTRLGRAAAGMMSGMQGQPVQDYTLEVEITDFTPIGPNAANVSVEFTESGTLTMPQAQTAGASQTDEALQTGSTEADPQQTEGGETTAQTTSGGQSLRIEATAECDHIVQRGEAEGELVIGLSNCQARTNLQPSSG